MSYRINVPEGTANTMKLTILGATGATGTTLTGQALAAGHEVTAVVRDPARPLMRPCGGAGTRPGELSLR